MHPNHRSEFLTLSTLVSALAGFVVMASVLLAQASAIGEAVVSSDLWDATVAETVQQLASLIP